MEKATFLQILGCMFSGFILFGYLTLGIITFIKTVPELKKSGAGLIWKIILFIFCIFITPLFFTGNYKIVKRD